MKLVSGQTEVMLAADDGIEFNGRKFRPDHTKGYVRFQMGSAFPNILAYGTSLHPAVVARCYGSLEHQPFDYEHQIAAYHEGERPDRILGSVVAASFPQEPAGGWKVSPSPDSAPRVDAVACYAKLAQGMRKVLGEHATGRHRWTVSMEVDYIWEESGFAIARAGKKPLSEFASTTPEDFSQAGWDYVPMSKASDDLKRTFSKQKNRIVGSYRGRAVSLLMGGTEGDIHFKGVGLVRYGAESAAQIQSLAATAPAFFEPAFSGLIELMKKCEVKK